MVGYGYWLLTCVHCTEKRDMLDHLAKLDIDVFMYRTILHKTKLENKDT